MSQQLRIDSYLMCATTRSGSTLLCGLCESTGVAGRPQSYFRRENRHMYTDSWDIPPATDGAIDSAFLHAAMKAGSTPNGVFGVRVMWATMPELTGALTRIFGPSATDVDLLSSAFGRTCFVHLRREDVLAQAVSWARAEQSHVWHVEDEVLPGGRSPEFDRDLISELASEVRAHEAAWTDWFSAQGVLPYEIEYQDLADDPVGVTQALLDFLGLDLPTGNTIEVRNVRQADDLNADWISRFQSS